MAPFSPVPSLAPHPGEGEALTLAYHLLVLLFGEQSWAVGGSEESSGSASPSLTGLPAIQPAPLRIPGICGVGGERGSIPSGYRVRLLVDRALGSETWVLAFLSQSPTDTSSRGCS